MGIVKSYLNIRKWLVSSWWHQCGYWNCFVEFKYDCASVFRWLVGNCIKIFTMVIPLITDCFEYLNSVVLILIFFLKILIFDCIVLLLVWFVDLIWFVQLLFESLQNLLRWLFMMVLQTCLLWCFELILAGYLVCSFNQHS